MKRILRSWRDSPRLLFVIIAVALLVRVVLSQLLPRDLLERPWEYDDVALNLLKGNGFLGYNRGIPQLAFVHPLYPVICAAVYGVIGHSSLTAMQVVQGAAAIPAAWLAYRLGSDIAGTRAGLLAAAGVTLHPALLVFSLRRHSLWFDSILFLATLPVTFRLRRAPETRRLVILGLLFGVAMLSRATIGVFMVFACAWLAWQWRAPLTEWLPRVAVIVGLALLVVTPWLVRNSLVFHRPTGMVSTNGYNLWIGNNPNTTGGALAADGRAMEATDPALYASLRGLDEGEQQDVYRQAALRYMAAHPGKAVLNFARKFRGFLFWSDQTGAWYPSSFRVPYQAFYLVLLACAVAGGHYLTRSGHAPAVVLLAGFVLSVGAVQSIYVVEGRHRWAVESALIVLTSVFVARATRHFRSRAAHPAQARE
jgi:hypothetical protein